MIKLHSLFAISVSGIGYCHRNGDGEETVQLYVNDKVASVVRPVKELKAFKKIFLKAGESKTVQFDISPLALGFYDAAMNYVVEPGEFEIMTGCNSNDLQTISVKLIN